MCSTWPMTATLGGAMVTSGVRKDLDRGLRRHRRARLGLAHLDGEWQLPGQRRVEAVAQRPERVAAPADHLAGADRAALRRPRAQRARRTEANDVDRREA